MFDLSVIIPCSRPDNIQLCLKGLERQETNKRFEVIVVGDTEKLLADQYQLDIKFIKCLDTHANTRRNIGIDSALSQRIAFLDDDTIPDERWVNAAINNCHPDSSIAITGPERPVQKGKTSQLIFAVANNFFSEGTKAHVNHKDSTVSWSDAIFCNFVIPACQFKLLGMLSTDVPWDMDDFEFCLRARNHITFKNVSELSIKHDRYPNSIKDFLKYKWSLRERTGVKLVTHPKIYCRFFLLIVVGFSPWILLASVSFTHISPLVIIGSLFIFYSGFLLLQVKTALNFVKGYELIKYLILMTALHGTIVLAVQFGIVKGIIHRIKKRVLRKN